MATPHSSSSVNSSLMQAIEFEKEASKRWRLRDLYQDLGAAKCKPLTSSEKTYLCGLLCNYGPSEIALQRHVLPASVRGVLSKGLYRHVEELIGQRTNKSVQIKRWHDIPHLLEQGGYRRRHVARDLSPHSSSLTPGEHEFIDAQPESHAEAHASWDCQPDISVFYNRIDELTTLKQWALQDRCRSIILYGLAGMGKTSLAAKLAHEIKGEFKRVIWRSLRNKPTIQALLTDILLFLDYSRQEQALNVPSKHISQLLNYLNQHRCLLILDDVQAILGSGELAGQYQPGFENYGELLRRIEEESHQSCVVLTSWENPKTFSRLRGADQPVRSYRVEGLGDEAKHILANAQLLDEHLWDDLIVPYRGNPLALRILASAIQDLFEGSVAEFIGQNTLFLGDLKRLLHQQFKRLSPIEKEVITCLANHEKPVSLTGIQSLIDSDIRNSRLMEVLNSLCRRSLIEKNKRKDKTEFTVQPTIEKYVKTR